ncbi:MAG: histidine triad nucleotide-binding protein [Puniceicoccales bacterium]|jgi:histidine triad (HIT) family protein|nr:histidine triad nucleotide-binding protein [Puniceicoccales bacterium]
MATLFEKIANREIPSEIVYEDDLCFVIRDIAPKAPAHLLIIPRKPLENLTAVAEEDVPLLGHLLLAANKMGKKYGGDGYRIVINNGKSAGQIVPHLHIHLLAGKDFSDGSC